MQRGQASVEWLATVGLVAVLLAGAAVVGRPALRADAVPAADHAWRSAARDGSGGHAAPAEPDPLVAAYGSGTAALVRRVAPGIVYERGMLAVPVDPRRCRAHRCADAPARAGPVTASATGLPVTLFVRVVERGGATYVQLWAYYPDSTWSGRARAAGAPCGCHPDDWESFQVRVGTDGEVHARASAHRGYTGRRIGPDLNVNQARPLTRAWTRATPWWRVARGSHAGHLTTAPRGRRFTPAAAIELLPLETVAAKLPQDYAVTPPWRKRVYRDPEAAGTG